jgi:hypothetical protein
MTDSQFIAQLIRKINGGLPISLVYSEKLQIIVMRG